MTVDGQTLIKAVRDRAAARQPRQRRRYAIVRALQLKVRDDITAASDMTNQIEWMRKQLEDQPKTVQGKETLLKSMDAIDKKMQDVEYKMITRAEALSDDKYFPTAYHIYMNLIWLNGEIGTGAGDVAGTARLRSHGNRQSAWCSIWRGSLRRCRRNIRI